MLVLLVAVSALPAHAHRDTWVGELAEAERLLLRGNYAESEAAFARLGDELPIRASLGLSRCHWEQGKQDLATSVLDAQIRRSDQSPDLHAQRAWVALQRGHWSICRRQLGLALETDPKHLQASWVRAELYRATGDLRQARLAYQQLAERFDREQKSLQSPQQLLWYGKALAQHARFNQDKQRFRQLTTRLYPRILTSEPNFWPAHLEIGLLLLEKFNASDAEAAFNDALRINPLAADIHAGLASLALRAFDLDRARRHINRALATNPNQLDALLCRADMRLASLRPAETIDTLKVAHKLNPNHAPTLGRLSAAYSLLDESAQEASSVDIDRVLETAATASNQGEYHASSALAFEHARRYPLAGESFREAIALAPALIGPRGHLGMIEMRLGHETAARNLLQASFERDPYNVRVKNQLEVLDLLDSYATLESEHFIFRFDGERDRTLARHMARHAERCYEELAATFRYELPEKALVEIFHNARGISAREWFGARMVGLPNIHTIAACGGNVIAMVSPTAERRQLNWADILRHEIVHLINIQQTDYAVPHWLTEGCAVWQENRPRRRQWNQLLAERVSRGDVFDLETINLGFLRPRSAEEWQLAYCQAELYIDLIAEKKGSDGIRRLLEAHRDNLPTELAIATSLDITMEELEQAYTNRLVEIVAQIVRDANIAPTDLADLTEHWKQNPTDWPTGGKLALARLRRGDYPGAGRLARQVLESAPDEPSARYVKAKLLVRIGEDETAAAELQQVAKSDSPHAESLKLLGAIYLRQNKLVEANRCYHDGAKLQPGNLQWTKAMAVVAMRQQNSDELNRLLKRIASAEPDNLVVRKKLLQLSTAAGDPVQIRLWADEVLHLEPGSSSANQAWQEYQSESHLND
ncbi:MAG: tetratricopeptide repeat protein [Planctomycetota bacterium]